MKHKIPGGKVPRSASDWEGEIEANRKRDAEQAEAERLWRQYEAQRKGEAK